MIVYRIAHKHYIDDRDGMGAKLFGGRWNAINLPCIYTSIHISLALLEKFIHAKVAENMQNISLLKIELPEDQIFNIDKNKLKSSWIDDVEYTQWLGAQILEDHSILAFSVPSAIVPEERNVIINPLSANFKSVKFLEITDFDTDYRLLGKLLDSAI